MAVFHILIVMLCGVRNSQAEYVTYTAQLGSSSMDSSGHTPYTFNWSVSTQRDRLQFEACLFIEPTEAVRFFGLGFGAIDTGPYEMDTYMIYSDEPPNVPLFLEGYTDPGGIFHKRDPSSHSASNVQISTSLDDRICLRFVRKALSCVKHGYTIDDQTTRVFLFHDYRQYSDWLEDRQYSGRYGNSVSRTRSKWPTLDLLEINQSKLNLSRAHFEMVRLQLIKSPQERNLPSLESTRTFELRVNEVQIPAADTTYWCKTAELPKFERKHHIIRYEPVIDGANQGLVHHMEVFLCVGSEPVRQYDAPCNSETKPMGLTNCRNVIGAWAMGATGLTLPMETGIAIGEPGSSTHVVIEIHYNNPNNVAGHVDSSGLRFYVTDQLRPYDAGLIELGLVYSARSAIPPGQSRFALNGYCDSKCTDLAFPPDGIIVFASQLHTHGTGVQVATYHMRGDKRLSDLNRDDHYSPHFQEIRLLEHPVHVKRGDTLVTRCTHDTSDTDHVLFGGLSKRDEMCLNYIFYYPKTDLELCKSEVAQPELDEFLRTLSRQDSLSGSIKDKFNAIQWNDEAAKELRKFYNHATIEMHCNSSSGTRIRNSAIHVTPIKVPERSSVDILWKKLQCLLTN